MTKPDLVSQKIDRLERIIDKLASLPAEEQGSASAREATDAPRADVALRVRGNTATETGVRWYHAEAFARTDVPARDARIRVRVDNGDYVPWQWARAEMSTTVDGGGVLLPLVIGMIEASGASPARPIATGWYVELDIWRWTPAAHLTMSEGFWPFGPRRTHRFDVEVSWVEGSRQRHAYGSFELRFGETLGDEPEFGALSEPQ